VAGFEIILFLALAIPFWAAVIYVAGWLDGWQRLAAHYPALDPPDGERFVFQTLEMGWATYGNCMIIHRNADGLHLWPMWPFRYGHPPIFLPWSAFHDCYERSVLLVGWRMICQVGEPTLATLNLSPRLFEDSPVAIRRPDAPNER
jgi:hypothetical protein